MELGALIRKYRRAKDWSQTDLGRMVGVSQPSIQAIEVGKSQRKGRPPTKTPEKIREIVEALEIPIKELPPHIVEVLNPKVISFSMSGARHLLDNDTTHSRRYDFPVYYSSGATGLADHGVIIVSAEPVEYIERPTLLMKVKNSYGMRVGDTTMEPAYRLGDVIFLHPFMHAAADSYVLLRSESNESHGQKRAMIGLLLGESLTHWNLRKYNPPADFSVLKTDWPIADHIAGKYNR